MSKQCLDVHQMQHLQELGLKLDYNTMLSWIIDERGKDKPFSCISSESIDYVDFSHYCLPAYTLQDVLDALPEKIMNKRKDYLIEIWKRDGEWTTGYLFFDIEEDVVHLHDETDKSLIDAVYSMLCWCIEQGYVETNKNE